MALDCSNAEAEDIAAGIPRRSAIQKIFSQNGRFPHPAASIRAHGAPSARTGRVATFRTGTRYGRLRIRLGIRLKSSRFPAGQCPMAIGRFCVLNMFVTAQSTRIPSRHENRD
jgi:hypothetical protein